MMFVSVERALFSFILLCWVGQSSLAKKDSAFVPTGPLQRLGLKAGLWGLRTLGFSPCWVVF